jgi:hypothetical protein
VVKLTKTTIRFKCIKPKIKVMIEYMITQQTFLVFFGFLIAEMVSRAKFKILISFQSLKNIRTNLEKISNKITRKKSSYFVLNLGKKTFDVHHSRIGWFLAVISLIASSLSLLSFSLGIIFHHLIKEKKLF